MAAVSRPSFSEGICGEGLLLTPALGSSEVRGATAVPVTEEGLAPLGSRG